MDNIRKNIELLANIAIIVIAILLGSVLVKNYLFRQPALKDEQNVQMAFKEARRGEKANVSGIDWQKNGQTLVLVLSTTCHFCSESAPFYQQLVKAKSDTRLVAVLPQAVEEGRYYLERLGISVDEIKQTPLNSINVRGTPTLILVNRDGIIVNTWVGKLATAQEEEEVLSAVQSRQAD